MTTRIALRRSLLYVPGDRAAMLAKAAGRGADGLILNLEDAVAPSNKEQARSLVAQALAGLDFGAAEVIVRINPPDSDAGFRDLLEIAPRRPHAILLPKVRAAEDVRTVAWLLDRLESLHPAPDRAPIRMMCMIESAAGVLAAREIAACAPQRMAALVFGANDLAEDLQCAPGSPALLQAAGQVLLAARSAGIAAIDTPHVRIDDPAGLTRSAQAAREMGFDGKSAIHPAQVAAINAAFSPTAEQTAWAERVLATVPDGDPARLGATLLDGQLIEAPHLLRAQRILAAARRLAS